MAEVARPALYFDAVDGTCDVFIDDKKVGQQKGNPGYTWQHSFFVPLESGLAPGKHALALRVQKANYNADIWRPVRIVNKALPLLALGMLMPRWRQ